MFAVTFCGISHTSMAALGSFGAREAVKVAEAGAGSGRGNNTNYCKLLAEASKNSQSL